METASDIEATTRSTVLREAKAERALRAAQAKVEELNEAFLKARRARIKAQQMADKIYNSEDIMNDIMVRVSGGESVGVTKKYPYSRDY